MSYVNFENVTLSYEGQSIIKDLTFSVEAGDYLCVVGENGSGKSTLLKAMIGLKRPSAGSITFGDGVTGKDIGYVPQTWSQNKSFPATVYEVVTSGLLNKSGFRPFFTGAEKKRAAECMDRLGISDIKGKCVRDLSGGQRQRVLIARAMCAAEKLLILDEPAAGLDPLISSQMYEIIKKLNDIEGISVVMVSHDIPSAVRYAKRILHIDSTSGFLGTASEYREYAKGKHFLGCQCDLCRMETHKDE